MYLFDKTKTNITFKENEEQWILLLIGISILIVLLFVLYISNNITKEEDITSFSEITTSLSSGSNLSGNKIFSYCPVNQCAASITTGLKRCPSSNNQRLLYDVSQEVCTFSDSCTNEFLPYALLKDGSVNENGICDIDGCRCVNYRSCEKDIIVKFSMEDGNVYSDVNYKFEQYPLVKIGEDTLKLDTFDEFCRINPAFLYKVVGGCNFGEGINYPINFNNREDIESYTSVNYEPNYKNMLKCFNDNPCIQGVLSYSSKDIDNTNFLIYDISSPEKYLQDTIFNTVGCHTGVSCTEYEEGRFDDECLFFSKPSDSIFFGGDNISDMHLKCLGLKDTIFNVVPDAENETADFNFLTYNTPNTIPYPNQTELNLYYPVFDNKKKKIVCERLKPLLLTSVILTDKGKISSIRIDASGKDFGHYRRIVGRKGYYYFENENRDTVYKGGDKLELGLLDENGKEITDVTIEVGVSGKEVANGSDKDIRWYSTGVAEEYAYNYGINNYENEVYLNYNSSGTTIKSTRYESLRNGRITSIIVTSGSSKIFTSSDGKTFIPPRVYIKNYKFPVN